MDKLDRLGVDGVRQLLGRGRKDESGDFTKGAELSNDQIETIEKLYAHQATRSQDFFMRRTTTDAASDDDMTLVGYPDQVVGDPRFLDTYSKLFPDSELVQEGIGELRAISDIVRSAGYGTRRIRIDVSVVRGLEYYTGPVYEVELTFEIRDDAGRPVRFGSVGGGGRYDGLVARFRGEPVPATGFSIGVSRLLAALDALGKIDTKAETGPVVVTVLDRERIADYQRMVSALRNAGIRAELYLGAGKMGPQFKYADRRGSPCVVIQGGDEKAKGEVQIKDLIEGAKAAAAIASNREWRAERPAQFACKEEELVAKVREVLARHGLKGV
jgi:histidyl-tRNA synthetase